MSNTKYPITQTVYTIPSPDSPVPVSSDVNIVQVGGSPITLGQTTSVNSLPVVLASDQSPLSVAGSVSGTVNSNVNGLNHFSVVQYAVGVTPIQITVPVGTTGLSIKAITTMSNNVLVGNSGSLNNLLDGSGNGYFLFNGDSLQLDVTPVADVWVIGTAVGQIISVLFVGN